MNQLSELINKQPLIWGHYYFRHHFRKPSPPFHVKILNEATKHLYLAIAAPRESSKTTILGFLYPMHQITFKKKRFIIIITSVWSKSCDILATIKSEIRNNQLYMQDYNIEITKDAGDDSIFRHSDGFETRVLCKGRDQIGDIRGSKFGAYRPDLFIVDDVEDDKQVLNPERRQELQDNFDEVLMFAGEKGKSQYIIIGTILHDDGQLAKLVSKDQYPDFRKLYYIARYKGKDGKKKSIWEEKWSVDDLNKLEKKNPTSFAKEMQNDPVSGMLQKFYRKDFRYWTIENMQYVLYGSEGNIESRDDLIKCKAAIACDLAWEEKKEDDYSVIMPGFLTPRSELLIDTYFCKKGMKPDEIEEILFSMENRLRLLTNGSVFIGFEKAKLEKVMKWLLREAMKKRNHYLLFKDLMWDKDKITRIVTRLQPRYAQHVVFHRRGMGDLEHQLLRVPSGTHEDLPDAAQGLVQLLQYPKSTKSAKKQENEFDWWRRKAIESRKPSKKKYVYGSRGKNIELPFKVAYR